MTFFQGWVEYARHQNNLSHYRAFKLALLITVLHTMVSRELLNGFKDQLNKVDYPKWKKKNPLVLPSPP